MQANTATPDTATPDTLAATPVAWDVLPRICDLGTRYSFETQFDIEMDLITKMILNYFRSLIPEIEPRGSKSVTDGTPSSKRPLPGKLDFTDRLSLEILREIFGYLYLESLEPSSAHPSVSGKLVHDLWWPASQVCAYWRAAALSLPFLWAHLPRLKLDLLNEEALAKQSAMLEVLLDRARYDSLHISIAGPWNLDVFDIPDTAFNLMGPIIYDLTRRFNQWKSLSISAAAITVEVNFLSECKYLPHLETLALDFLDGPEIDVTSLRNAPRLKFVHITGCVPKGSLILNTGSLIRLHDDIGALMHSIIPTYHRFSSLIALELRDENICWEPVDHETFIFPVLETLKYYHERSNINDGFMRYAITPALEELSVKTVSQEDIMEELLGMCLKNGGLPLKTLRLRIRSNGCEMNRFGEVLRLLPNLENLDAHLPFNADISLLSVVQGPEALVPRLLKCSFLWDGENSDDVHQALARLASARCSPLLADTEEGRVAVMQLSLQMEVPICARSHHTRGGFGHQKYYHLAVHPTKLEPWYENKYQGQRRSTESEPSPDVYMAAVAMIPTMLPRWSGQVDRSSVEYRHTLELLESVETSYNASQLIEFLENNTNICMIALAYTLKKCDPTGSQGRNSPYERVLRLMKTVKTDLMNRLDDFHWIWETTTDVYSLRYIPDQHEMRADQDKFANAVLGLSDDQWFLDDF